MVDNTGNAHGVAPDKGTLDGPVLSVLEQRNLSSHEHGPANLTSIYPSANLTARQSGDYWLANIAHGQVWHTKAGWSLRPTFFTLRIVLHRHRDLQLIPRTTSRCPSDLRIISFTAMSKTLAPRAMESPTIPSPSTMPSPAADAAGLPVALPRLQAYVHPIRPTLETSWN
jgi:hypothetical protein